MASKESVMAEISNAIQQEFQVLLSKLETRITPMLSKIEALEKKMFSIRDDVHLLLEDSELRRTLILLFTALQKLREDAVTNKLPKNSSMIWYRNSTST